MVHFWSAIRQSFWDRRFSIATAAAGFTAFVNLYALQSLLPHLCQVFEASEREVSLTITASTLAVALAAPFAGWLIGRMGRRNLTVLAVVGLVVCGLNVAAAESLSSMLAWRFFQGLFLPLIVAGIMAFIGEEFPREKVAGAMACYVTWTVIGGFSGRWLAGFLTEGLNWRAALVVLALLNAVSGAILLSALPKQRAIKPGRLSRGLRKVLLTALKPELRPVFVTGFGSLFTMAGVFTYVTFHLAKAPFSLGPEGLGQLFCVYLLGIVITPLVGRLMPRVGLQRTLRFAARSALFGLALTWIPVLWSVVAGLAVISCAAFAAQMAASAYIAQSQGRNRAQASGLYLSCYYLGGAMGAAVPGLFWEPWGWPGCLALFVVVQLCLFRASTRFPE